MSIKLESNVQNIYIKIDALNAALEKNSNHIINDRLEVVQRGRLTNLYWCFLSYFSPFTEYLFRKDLLAHVRVKNVSIGLVKYCQANEKYLFENQDILKKIKDVIDKLNTKTKKKYDLDSFAKYLDRADTAIQDRNNRRELVLDGEYLQRLKMEIPAKEQIRAIAAYFKNADDIRFVPDSQGGQVEFYENSPWDHTQRKVHTLPTSYPLQFKRSSEKHRNIEEIILLGNVLLGKGSQKDVFAAFNLTTGIDLVRKKYENDLERQLFERFYDKSFTAVAKAYTTRILKPLDKSAKIMMEILQPKYVADLEVIKGYDLAVWQRGKICLNLLKGLAQLHEITHDNMKFAHQDIKPSNIFIKRDFTPYIGDFGVSTYLIEARSVAGSVKYMCPTKVTLFRIRCEINERAKKLNEEVIRFNENARGGYRMFDLYPSTLESDGRISMCRTYTQVKIDLDSRGKRLVIENNNFDKELESFIKQYGQAEDVWSLGLILAGILSNKGTNADPFNAFFAEIIQRLTDDERRAAPTPSRFEGLRGNVPLGFRGLNPDPMMELGSAFGIPQKKEDPTEKFCKMSSKITQADVNRALRKYFVDGSEIFKILSKMLQVDPAKRITAKAALNLFKQMVRDIPQLQPPVSERKGQASS